MLSISTINSTTPPTSTEEINFYDNIQKILNSSCENNAYIAESMLVGNIPDDAMNIHHKIMDFLKSYERLAYMRAMTNHIIIPRYEQFLPLFKQLKDAIAAIYAKDAPPLNDLLLKKINRLLLEHLDKMHDSGAFWYPRVNPLLTELKAIFNQKVIVNNGEYQTIPVIETVNSNDSVTCCFVPFLSFWNDSSKPTNRCHLLKQANQSHSHHEYNEPTLLEPFKRNICNNKQGFYVSNEIVQYALQMMCIDRSLNSYIELHDIYNQNRRNMLQNHPDKTGDPATVKKFQRAKYGFDLVMAIEFFENQHESPQEKNARIEKLLEELNIIIEIKDDRENIRHKIQHLRQETYMQMQKLAEQERIVHDFERHI